MRPRRSWIPNLITLAALICGFQAVLWLVAGPPWYKPAALLLLVAAALDVLDGAAARYLGVTSAYGQTLDSLVDAVAFALTPPLVLYLHILHEAGWLGFAVASFYLCCAIARLARHTLRGHTDAPRKFAGLSVEGGGAMAGYLVLRSEPVSVEVTIVVTILAGLFMISTIPLPGVPYLFFRSPWPVRILAWVSVAFVMSNTDTWNYLPAVYIALGALLTLFRRRRPVDHIDPADAPASH